MRAIQWFVATALGLTAGCYSVEPVTSARPVVGTRVEMAITDEGRVALGGRMGPEIRRVEGNLLARQDNDYLVSVIGVNYLNGIFQPWKGETVRINSDMVSGFYEKRFSKGRTIALATLLAATGYVLRPRSIKSSFPEEEEPPPPSHSRLRPVALIRFAPPR